MSTPDTFGGKAALTMAHVIGMIDMVALPVWIGALMQYYKYSPPQAGITVTLFLLGVVLSSVFFAPRFNRTPRKVATASGFAIAGVAFFMASQQPVAVTSFQALAALHAVAGLGVGCALTFTHGSIGRSANPHRLFAVVNIVLGVFAVFFLGGMPQLIQHVSPSILFTVIAALMGLTAVVMALAFPVIPDTPAVTATGTEQSIARLRIPGVSWFVIAVVICLTLNQSMVFAFLERIGAERSFGADRVNGVLIALGLVNLTPGVLAAVLQKKWSPVAVGMGGPVGQAVLAVVMTSAAAFLPYAVAASLYVFMVIFTHNFLFGLLSRLDPSGRAAAATPAMMMIGACIGPALGGAIVQGLGYQGLGWAACVFAFVAVMGMLQVRRHLPAASAQAADMQPIHA
ncbi:MAG: MFS transporter [Pseudomonadota bacterium]